ncbi:hypothetical protein DAI22_01g247533 [Oryza sativa Japonica Group]|nr:hypothetical protein DAI22_01g247533 [Oryza sativa Japonica Group]
MSTLRLPRPSWSRARLGPQFLFSFLSLSLSLSLPSSSTRRPSDISETNRLAVASRTPLAGARYTGKQRLRRDLSHSLARSRMHGRRGRCYGGGGIVGKRREHVVVVSSRGANGRSRLVKAGARGGRLCPTVRGPPPPRSTRVVVRPCVRSRSRFDSPPFVFPRCLCALLFFSLFSFCRSLIFFSPILFFPSFIKNGEDTLGALLDYFYIYSVSCGCGYHLPQQHIASSFLC